MDNYRKCYWIRLIRKISQIQLESVIMTEGYWSTNPLPTFLTSGNSVITDKFPDDFWCTLKKTVITHTTFIRPPYFKSEKLSCIVNSISKQCRKEHSFLKMIHVSLNYKKVQKWDGCQGYLMVVMEDAFSLLPLGENLRQWLHWTGT